MKVHTHKKKIKKNIGNQWANTKGISLMLLIIVVIVMIIIARSSYFYFTEE